MVRYRVRLGRSDRFLWGRFPLIHLRNRRFGRDRVLILPIESRSEEIKRPERHKKEKNAPTKSTGTTGRVPSRFFSITIGGLRGGAGRIGETFSGRFGVKVRIVESFGRSPTRSPERILPRNWIRIIPLRPIPSIMPPQIPRIGVVSAFAPFPVFGRNVAP